MGKSDNVKLIGKIGAGLAFLAATIWTAAAGKKTIKNGVDDWRQNQQNYNPPKK